MQLNPTRSRLRSQRLYPCKQNSSSHPLPSSTFCIALIRKIKWKFAFASMRISNLDLILGWGRCLRLWTYHRDQIPLQNRITPVIAISVKTLALTSNRTFSSNACCIASWTASWTAWPQTCRLQMVREHYIYGQQILAWSKLILTYWCLLRSTPASKYWDVLLSHSRNIIKGVLLYILVMKCRTVI